MAASNGRTPALRAESRGRTTLSRMERPRSHRRIPSPTTLYRLGPFLACFSILYFSNCWHPDTSDTTVPLLHLDMDSHPGVI